MARDTFELMDQLGIDGAVVVGFSDGGIIGLDMAIHRPRRVVKLVVIGANARFDGYATENQNWVREFDPEALPVSADYARLSPDGVEHWPLLLRRVQTMWGSEPNFTAGATAASACRSHGSRLV